MKKWNNILVGILFFLAMIPAKGESENTVVQNIEVQLRELRQKENDNVSLKGFLYICAYGTSEDVKKALTAGANAQLGNQSSDLPPLSAAASYNPDPKVIELLLDAGADINQVSGKENRTALHYALMTNPDAYSVVETLLVANPDIYVLDRFLYTPIDFAISGHYRNGAFDANPREDLILLLLEAAKRLPYTMQRGDRKSFMTKKLRQYDINMGEGWRDRDVLAAFISLGADERVMKDR